MQPATDMVPAGDIGEFGFLFAADGHDAAAAIAEFAAPGKRNQAGDHALDLAKPFSFTGRATA
jgi:hypothetical protein